MEHLDQAALDAELAKTTPPPPFPIETVPSTNGIVLQEESIAEIIQTLKDPVVLQKEIIAKVKIILDHRIAQETLNVGVITESTRKLAADYYEMLNSLHKNLYGEKNINLNLNTKISHGQIGALIRKYKEEKVTTGDIIDGTARTLPEHAVHDQQD